MKQYFRQLADLLESRKKEERVLLLVAFVAIIGFLAFILVIEPMQVDRANLERSLVAVNAQIQQESNKQAEINATYTDDPDSIARARRQSLQDANADADRRLDNLYGRLIDPGEMSRMLSRILERETTLNLVALNNKPSELLLTTAISAGVDAAGRQRTVEVYRHGMTMVFEGSYLETVRYLRSLEELESNFFWEAMDYEVDEYPEARITVEIYTLSTHKGWIGV